jgi:DNA-binding FadR family transcriptional regulator
MGEGTRNSGGAAGQASTDVGDAVLRRAASLNTDRSRLSARIADVIARTILEDEVQPGSKLPSERVMLEQFGNVGRASLREALRLLEADGLLRMKMGPKGGPEVLHPDIGQVTRILLLFLITSKATLRDVYAVRAAIDPATAALVAEEADAAAIETLQESVERQKKSVRSEESFIEQNEVFHRLVAENCRNPMLAAISISLLSILAGHEEGIRYGLAARRSVVALHEEIVSAIAAHDPDAAAKAASAHVETALAYFEKRFPNALDQVLNPASFTGYFAS